MYTFVVRDPEKAYLGAELYLPRGLVNTQHIKSHLEFVITIDGEQAFLNLWHEAENHIVVPRCYLSESQTAAAPFPIVSLLPGKFKHVPFHSKIVLDAPWFEKDDVQRRAFAAWLRSRSGIFNVACGKGKTVIALYCIAHSQAPALVIVEKGDLMEQWRAEAEELLEFPGRVGTIQGNPETWDWRQPIVVAMMQTLALYPDHVSPEMRRHFATIWWDECHHLAAPYFSQTATMFPGRRHGLSATIGREDGMEPVFFYHIGQPIFTDLRQDIVPDTYFRRTPFTVDMHDPEVVAAVTDKNGEPNTSRLRNYMATLPERIEYQCHDLRQALAAGRKILALSHCKEQLYIMHEIFGTEVSGISTGDEKKSKRRAALVEKQLVFGTHQLVLEGLDEPSLDFLVWLTPFGSQHPEGGVNALQQGIGRTQRPLPGKPQPMVLIYDDIHVREFHRMCQKLRYQLRNWPEEKGGPYTYTNLKLREDIDV